jgi:hypothetical protein
MSVQIDNVKETRRAMAKFAPEVKKALDKANREAGAPLLALARSYVPELPLSNWIYGRTAYDKSTVQKGIKIKQGKRSKGSPYSAVTQLRNESVAGSIFELAGKKSPNSTFARNLGGKFPLGDVTRLIWKAVKNYPIRKYQDKVTENYAEAEKQLQQTLDAMRSSV